MPADDTGKYTVSSLSYRYCLDVGEAERLIARFGSGQRELDRLLGARARSPRHRRREMSTPDDVAAFGLR